jgi:hypothetical protein
MDEKTLLLTAIYEWLTTEDRSIPRGIGTLKNLRDRIVWEIPTVEDGSIKPPQNFEIVKVLHN